MAHLNAAVLDGTDQVEVRARILDFIAAHPDALHRTCLDGHLTGSGVVVDPATGESLLINHVKLGRWLQPGGHADGDPDTAAVARREAMEETGLQQLELLPPCAGDPPTPFDLDVHIIPARHNAAGELIEDAHEHHDVRYLFRAVGDETLVTSEESHAVRWATPGKARKLTDDPSVLRMLDKAASLEIGG